MKIKIYLKLSIIKLNHFKFLNINIQKIVIKVKIKIKKVINLGNCNKINLLLTCIEIDYSIYLFYNLFLIF